MVAAAASKVATRKLLVVVEEESARRKKMCFCSLQEERKAIFQFIIVGLIPYYKHVPLPDARTPESLSPPAIKNFPSRIE